MNTKKTYFVYIGWSLVRGEEHCVTLGISSDGWRRSYNKLMNINFVMPCKCLAHARAVERAGQDFYDKRKIRAFVKWSPLDLETSPNRGFDWWITSKGLSPSETSELVERLRHVQFHWSEENHKLFMARVRAKTKAQRLQDELLSEYFVRGGA